MSVQVTDQELADLVAKMGEPGWKAVAILRNWLQGLLIMDDERLVGCLCECHSDPMREVHGTCVDCQREMLAERPVASPEALTAANAKIDLLHAHLAETQNALEAALADR